MVLTKGEDISLSRHKWVMEEEGDISNLLPNSLLMVGTESSNLLMEHLNIKSLPNNLLTVRRSMVSNNRRMEPHPTREEVMIKDLLLRRDLVDIGLKDSRTPDLDTRLNSRRMDILLNNNRVMVVVVVMIINY